MLSSMVQEDELSRDDDWEAGIERAIVAEVSPADDPSPSTEDARENTLTFIQ